jgi:hypothetical protein
MKNTFLDAPKQIMQEWKNLRSSMTTETLDHDQLLATVNFWSMAPLMTNYLNWDDTANWPDPWTMIGDNSYCVHMLALAMFYTLLLGKDQRWSTDRVKLVLASDADRTMQQLAVLVDEKYMLNLQYNTVVSSDSDGFNFVIHHAYHYNGKTHTISG